MKPIVYFLLVAVMGLFFSGCYGKPIKRYHEPYGYFSDEMFPLGEAIYDDRAADARRLMEAHGWGPDTVSEIGYSLLVYASMTSSKAVFKMLLEMGADPNKRCDVNISGPSEEPYYVPSWALETSFYQRDPYYVDALLKYGADVNTGAPLQGILSNAPHGKKLKLLKRFLDLGSDINAYDHRYDTPLHEAINGSNRECVDFLIERGADLTLPDGYGYTPPYLIQYQINRKKTDASREDYMKRIASTIERLQARGVTFPVPKPVIEGETFWEKRAREKAERAAADSLRREQARLDSSTYQPNRWTILNTE